MDRLGPETSRESFSRAAAAATPPVRVPVEFRLPDVDPFAAYRRARTGERSFFCETTGGQAGWGYFGVDPVEWLQVRDPATAIDEDCRGSTPAATGDGGQGPTLEALDAFLAGESLARGDCEVPYPGGVFGWLSYDVARELESLPDTTRDDRDLPRLQVGLYDAVAAWACPADGAVDLRVVACPRVEDEGDVDAAYDRGVARGRELAGAIQEGSPEAPGSPDVLDGSAPEPPATSRAEFTSDCGPAAYHRRVRRVKEYIRDGDTFQANISHRLTAPAAVSPVAVYDALRRVNPAPYAALLEFPGVDLVSASPELLLDVDGDRLATEPIAGTRPRGGTPAEDERLESELVGDEKERAEHAMLVDLERNDLGKVSAVGSVAVSEYRRVDRYSAVMHLVSLVEGRRRPSVRLVDAIAALFPGGTITGAPKPRTMEIIDELEDTRRGPYTGSVLAAGFDGSATLNIIIRTLVRVGGEYHLRVGGGVVHDSVPEREYRETLDKARALVEAVDDALAESVSLEVNGS